MRRATARPTGPFATVGTTSCRLACGCLDAVRAHPRHVVLALVVVGLLLGGRVPASVVAGAALAVAFGVLPVVRRPGFALALAAALLVAAGVGQARTAALDATRLPFGDRVAGDATVLATPRDDGFGGRRALVRLRGEPVLLRVPAWATMPSLRTGDVVAVRGTLRPPDLAARPVHAHATLRATALAATGRRRGGLLGVVDTVRRRAERALDQHLPQAEAALLRGMVLGDDAALPEDVADAFTDVGLSHLTAASGQNVALLAALVVGLSVVAGIGVRARWTATLLLIALYVPLAGGGPSIQRAGIMGAATIAAAFAGRPSSRWYVLLLAAVATLVLDPRAAADAGWQLSFAAVIGIALLARPLRERLPRLPSVLAEASAVTLAATIATAPLVVLHFGRASLLTVPANVLAAPAVAPVMWLGFAAAALGQLTPAPAVPPVALAELPLGFLVGVARTAAGLPDPPLPLAVAAGLLVLAAVRRRPRLVPLALVALLLTPHAPRPLPPPPPGTFRVTALDVGQGDATLLQADGHAVLVDAGPPGAPIVARLRAAGVRRLDALVLTHPQLDHDGGAPAVLRAVRTDVLLDGRDGDRSPTSTAVDGPARRAGTRIVPARAGQTLRTGALTLRVLWPPPRVVPSAAGDPNDRAIVALADAYHSTALLTADAESPILQPLDLPRVDVLKVSHHGSVDPGLPSLLERLRPRAALIEVGAHNTYGHPAPSTLAALRAAVPTIKRTDRDGTVRIDLRPP